MPVEFRYAGEGDLPGILDLLLADDILKARVKSRNYERTYADILNQPDNAMVVGVQDGAIVAVLQITYIPSLGYGGTWRAQIESVQVRQDLRGQGVGANLMAWAMERARERGCHIMQLTSDLRRVDARRFYERLGFVASHIGMKLEL